jgi:beta-glucanase (GH16 family)
MRNTATRTTKTTVDKSGLNRLLTDARMKSARARGVWQAVWLTSLTTLNQPTRH